MNSYAELEETTSFESVHGGVEMIEGYYLAKIDLKSAYRSVRILPEHETYSGLRWKQSDGGRAIVYGRYMLTVCSCKVKAVQVSLYTSMTFTL